MPLYETPGSRGSSPTAYLQTPKLWNGGEEIDSGDSVLLLNSVAVRLLVLVRASCFRAPYGVCSSAKPS